MTRPHPSAELDAEAEAAVRQRLQHSVDGAQPDLDTLLPHIVSSGRQLRRRRRLVSVAVTACGLGAAAGVGLVAVPALLDGHAGETIQVTPGQRPSSPVGPSSPVARPTSATDPAVPVPQPARRQSPPDTWRLDPRTATYYLTVLAPKARFSGFEGQQPAPDSGPAEVYAALAMNLGDGKVGLQVNVQEDFVSQPSGHQDQAAPGTGFFRCQSTERSNQGRIRCHDERLPDGSWLLEEEHRDGAATMLSADVLRPDNTRVVVGTGNTRHLERTGSRSHHITRAQLRRIAVSPLWDPYVPPSKRVQAAVKRTIRPFELLPG